MDGGSESFLQGCTLFCPLPRHSSDRSLLSSCPQDGGPIWPAGAAVYITRPPGHPTAVRQALPAPRNNYLGRSPLPRTSPSAACARDSARQGGGLGPARLSCRPLGANTSGCTGVWTLCALPITARWGCCSGWGMAPSCGPCWRSSATRAIWRPWQRSSGPTGLDAGAVVSGGERGERGAQKVHRSFFTALSFILQSSCPLPLHHPLLSHTKKKTMVARASRGVHQALFVILTTRRMHPHPCLASLQCALLHRRGGGAAAWGGRLPLSTVAAGGGERGGRTARAWGAGSVRDSIRIRVRFREYVVFAQTPEAFARPTMKTKHVATRWPRGSPWRAPFVSGYTPGGGTAGTPQSGRRSR